MLGETEGEVEGETDGETEGDADGETDGLTTVMVEDLRMSLISVNSSAILARLILLPPV